MSEYVMVPRELTWGMMEAWTEEVRKGLFGDNGDNGKPHKEYMADAYRAMIAAAPAPQGIGREAVQSLRYFLDVFEDREIPSTELIDEDERDKYIAVFKAILALLPTEPPAQGEG